MMQTRYISRDIVPIIARQSLHTRKQVVWSRVQTRANFVHTIQIWFGKTGRLPCYATKLRSCKTL